MLLRRTLNRHCLACCMTLFGLACGGCGPLFLPMTPRLNDADQHMVDRMWVNMLTPVGRVDHQVLLDTIVAGMMYQVGTDRLQMTVQKNLREGKVVMVVDCDRANPAADEFTVTVLDARGRTQRRERYSRQEVEECAKILWDVDDFSGFYSSPAKT